jgi:hypothetical protein
MEDGIGFSAALRSPATMVAGRRSFGETAEIRRAAYIVEEIKLVLTCTLVVLGGERILLSN